MHSPLRRRYARSAARSAWFGSWVVKRTPWPEAASARISRITLPWLPKSRLAVGSSSTTKCGSCASARARSELPLAPRDHRRGPLGEMLDAEALQHAECHRAVVRGRAAEQVAMRGASHQHHGFDGECEGRHMRLRHVCDEPRALARRMALQRRAANTHLTSDRREQYEQSLE